MKRKTNIIKNSNIILATVPIFVALALLWNVASGNLYTNYIIIGALVLGVLGIWRAIVS